MLSRVIKPTRLRNPKGLEGPHRVRPLGGLPSCGDKETVTFPPFPMMSLEGKWMFVAGGCGQQPDKSLRLNFSATPLGAGSEGLRSEDGDEIRDRMIDED
ncbi:hypothetical protein AVEN_190620-1 [Araneus ventricosus]|uniref:Uncharacterized protein n=1 Tax=Araneus ventricosus TaxID=182803 RepID=A0A4Y2XC98_ARAVE|nr:hypothetical protein AVEN_145744-1 [Araneus ventricosus]GBO46677.1 hypothetical protein AVEN_210973-1 [Araneus ventricosus]GBO46849.1 hypothetical protein AVEN_19233-1 [Araneus ventricosus]GBO46866.1 hypothetical protein AVEN_190620-1 [Araneus ventricosus]